MSARIYNKTWFKVLILVVCVPLLIALFIAFVYIVGNLINKDSFVSV
jgi:hypothetical protein